MRSALARLSRFFTALVAFRQLAFLAGTLFLLNMPILSHANELRCDRVFQNETRVRLLPFLKNRNATFTAVHAETQISLKKVQQDLLKRIQAAQVSNAKSTEAQTILNLIHTTKLNHADAHSRIFEIMARYGILVSHGYKKNLKNEIESYQEILNYNADPFDSTNVKNLKDLEDLMMEDRFIQFRDLYLKGLTAFYKTLQRPHTEKAQLVYTFEDLKIDDFIVNADTGYFFVGMSNRNGHSFDNVRDFSSISFFQHDLGHVDLALNIFRGLRENRFLPKDRSTLEKREAALNELRRLYGSIEQRFSGDDIKILRIALFTHLHEAGYTPYQTLFDYKNNPSEAAEAVYGQIRTNSPLMQSLRNRLPDESQAATEIAKILVRFVSP